MRSIRNLTILSGCILAGLLASCGGGDGCNGGGATAPCPPQTYGWARVTGFALTGDATPVAGERVIAVCPDGVGANESPTDADGRFSISLTYSVPDTLLQPVPPRQPDGSFRLDCRLSLMLGGDVLGAESRLEIPFGPSEAETIESAVELRLPPESAS